jgi:uroporphyrin-III C-methyltransferase
VNDTGVTGTVHLVGAGPGAPDLLTLRAARLLGEADIVFHDALVPDEILNLIRTTRRIPVGKRCGKHSTAQRFINKRLADAARRYKTVVRLKGGDPMLFGRADEEIRFLEKEGVKVEVVPGITAAFAASAELGTSLTRRGVSRSVVFATPRHGEGESPSQWARAAASADTAVLYMAAGDAEGVRKSLLEEGLHPDTPVAIVESASLNSKVFTAPLKELPAIASLCTGGPALLLIGEVLRELAQRYLPSTSGKVRSSAGAEDLPRVASQRA